MALSLLDRTNSISKESPSSLLPPEPGQKRSLFQRDAEPAPKVGPSSLLGDAPADPYRREQEELVAVSPASLLPPPMEPARRRWVLVAGGIAILVAVVVLLVLAFRSAEKPTETLMQEAIAYADEGKHEAAAIQLKNVLLREPDRVDANLLMGKALRATGALLDAEKALQRARELGASADEVIPLLVAVLLDLDRHEEALKELANAVGLKLASAQDALLRGRAFLGLGNLVEAKTQFTIARKDAPAEAMAYLARVMIQQGDPDGARKLIDESLAAHADSVGGWIAKGDLLRGLGENKEALAAYRQALALKSDNIEAILGVAVTHIGQEDMAEAKKELRKARALSPSNHLVGFTAALIDFREKRYQESREKLQGVLAVAPNHMPSVLLAGALNFAMGDIELAHRAFVSYLSRVPGHIQARKMLAITLLRKQQPEAAVESLAPFLDFDIRDGEIYAVAGQAYMQIGDVKRARELLTKASALDPKNATTLTDLGLATLSSGAGDAGIAELRKAVALEPKNARPDRQLALALLARNRADEAVAVADHLERRLPGIAEPHWLRGLASSFGNDGARARAHFEQALKVNPAFFPAAAALAELDAKDGRPRDSRVRFEAVLQRNPRLVEAILALAAMDAEEGKLDDGIARVRRAAADFSGSVRVQTLLASLLMQAGKPQDAMSAARRARELGPRDGRAAELLGQIQFATGDLEGAALSFTSLVNMQPRYLPGRLQLAQAQRAAGEHRTAIATARDALGIAPRNAEALSLLGGMLLADKRYDEALGLAAKARQLHPKLALGHTLEGEIRLAQGEPQRALQAFKAADALEPSGLLRIRLHQAESAVTGRDAPVDGLLEWAQREPSDTSVRMYVANVLVRMGQVEEALGHYQAVLKAAPQDYRILNNIADALMRKGDPRALDYAQQAFQIRPTDPIIVGTLGGVYLRNGSLYEAVQTLQKATQLAPENGEIRYQFVQALAKAGDRTRARAELKQLLASGLKFAQLAEARALAETL